jgi:hypothetical protein
MSTRTPWQLSEPDAATILRQHPDALAALARAEVPALVFRKAYAPEACQALMRRLVREELLYDPGQPTPEAFREQAIPEGYYREGRSAENRYAWESAASTGKARIDIGTSLGYRGSDLDGFLAHSQETHALFERLFAQGDDPVKTLYGALQSVAGAKRVMTAREPDGREYGPAIIRAHYGGYTYAPHFDSVRLREKRADYAVHGFEHQFAGVLVLQNAQRDGLSAQCTLHRCLWQPEIDPYLRTRTFHDYARSNDIEQVTVDLEPGDLYFFNTRCIHEVPGVDGDLPRVVVATFIGWDEGRDEIYVWS